MKLALRICVIFLGVVMAVGIYVAANAPPPPKPMPPDPKTAEGKLEMQRDSQNFLRILFAKGCEETFLKHGLDVQCAADNEKRTLTLVGPPVNRVFAYHFMTTKTMDGIRKAGFDTITFWNGKGGFSDDLYMQHYDIRRPSANRAKR